MKIKKLSDKELNQLIKTTDIYKIEEMYFMCKINLSSKQLDYLISQKKRGKK